MRNTALLLVLIALPLSAARAAAQDAPHEPAVAVASAEGSDAPCPAQCAAGEAPTGDLGLYVGVGLGSNLNLGGGSFGYQLEASVGLFYRMFAAEILGGTTAFNSDDFASVGPHVGAAVRVNLLPDRPVGLQLGAGARYHSARPPNGSDENFTGGFASLRLLLPVADQVNVRIDAEFEHTFGGPMSGVAANRLMLGFGVETRVSP